MGAHKPRLLHCKIIASWVHRTERYYAKYRAMCTYYDRRNTESLTNSRFVFNGGSFAREAAAMASRSRNRVTSALNSLCNDGLGHSLNTNHEEFEALIEEYFDDDESDVESECGKESIKIFLPCRGKNST